MFFLLHLEQTFLPMTEIFTEGDKIESRLPFKIFSSLIVWLIRHGGLSRDLHALGYQIQNIVEKKNLIWHILLIEKQESVEEENPFSLDANSRGAASASVSETVKNTDSGEYGKRTVASNWTKYEMPPSDSEDDENIIGKTFTENLDSKRHLLEFSWLI